MGRRIPLCAARASSLPVDLAHLIGGNGSNRPFRIGDRLSPSLLAFRDYDRPAGEVGRSGCEAVRRDRLVLTGLPGRAAGSVASARLVAPRAFRMGLDVAAGANAACDFTAVLRFAGVRPKPKALATDDRRSE